MLNNKQCRMRGPTVASSSTKSFVSEQIKPLESKVCMSGAQLFLHFPSLATMINYLCFLFFASPQKQCKRLWCTSAEGDHKGCRTQHMPLADGTDCGHGMVSRSTRGFI